jgi:hypothetical protein
VVWVGGNLGFIKNQKKHQGQKSTQAYNEHDHQIVLFLLSILVSLSVLIEKILP